MKNTLRLLSMLLAVCMLAACSQPSNNGETPSATATLTETASPADTGAATPEQSGEPVGLKDDFYTAMNATWLEETEIPADMPLAGGFYDLSDGIDEKLMADFDAMLAGDVVPEDARLAEFIEYYRLALDFEARDAAGVKPAQPYIDMVKGIESIEDIQANWKQLDEAGISLPLMFACTADMGNAATNAVVAAQPSIYLSDKTYYEDGNLSGTMMANAYKSMAVELLKLAGEGDDDAAAIAEQAMAFDALIAPHTKGAAESSDYTKLHNPVAYDEFAAMSKNMDLGAAVTDLLGQQPDKVVLYNPEYVAAIDELFNADNFEMIKSWMYLNTVVSFANYLSEDFRLAADKYTQAMTGATESVPREEHAYSLTSGVFREIVGVYYGQKYFGEEAREDVREMVGNIINTFEQRINSNEWLSQPTKDMAVKKLKAMAINVGYPDKLNPFYDEMVVVKKEDGGDLVSNAMQMTKLSKQFIYSQYGQPVDREQWPLSANTVNAMYAPQSNSINFPAAILQAPFYSIEQSDSANYGGIGAVIAHEITHAFDTNGSKFDELGNLADWWTAEDYAKFEELSMQMVEQFEGLEHAGGKVNGEMTKAENIADAGGLACALEAIQAVEGADLEAFFTNWAVIWRFKTTPLVESQLLTMDNHAPNKLRSNMQMMNMDEFYEVFDIKEGDGMYLAPEERVTIW